MFHWCRGWWGARGQTMHPPLFFGKNLSSYPRNWKRGCFLIIRWYSVLLVLSKTWGGHDRDRIVVEFKLSVQSVPIISNITCSNPPRGEVFAMQLYLIKFVSDLRHVGGFLRVLRFPPSITRTSTIYLKYCWKWR